MRLTISKPQKADLKPVKKPIKEYTFEETTEALYSPNLSTSELTKLLKHMENLLRDPKIAAFVIKQFHKSGKYLKNMLYYDEEAVNRTITHLENYKKMKR